MCNDMVFNGKVFDFRQIINIVELCIASWFKAKWHDCINLVLDAVRFSNAIQVLLKAKATKKVILWKILPLDALKFNVNGSTRGKPRPVGITVCLEIVRLRLKLFFPKLLEWLI